MSNLPNIPSDRITEELQKLYQLFQNGAINADEYAQAKSKLLGPAPITQTKPIAESLNLDIQIQLLQVEMENALLRVEQAWEQERQSYLISRRGGSLREPSKIDVWFSNILGAVFILSIFLLPLAKSPKDVVMFLLLVIAGCGLLIRANRLADFQEAEDAYRMHRSDTYDRYSRRIQEQQLKKQSSTDHE
jgi:hypothetical protein